MHTVGQAELGALRPAFAQLDQWLGRDQDPILTAVQPGSRMALDDAATDPHQLSHAVLSALAHGLDHLSCFRSLVMDAGYLHIYAPFTLLRAAMEDFATALWVMQPDSHELRVQRRLQLATADIGREAEVKLLTGHHDEAENQRRLKVIADRAVAAGVRRDVALGKAPGWERIVREGGDASPVGGELLLLMWKCCSGITHGQQWATLGLLQRQALEDSDTEGVIRVQLSAPDETMVMLYQLVTVTCRDTWRLYDKHRLSWRDVPAR